MEPRHPPRRLNDDDRSTLAGWFAASGKDETSEDWAAAWSALVHAKLAGDHGLIRWPTSQDGQDEDPEDVFAAHKATLAVQAGAQFAQVNVTGKHAKDPPAEGGLQVGPGLAVGVVLAVLDRHKGFRRHLVSTPAEQRVLQAVTELHRLLVGVFEDACTALSALVGDARVNAARQMGAAALTSFPWPVIVDLVVREATKDVVFAEHLLLQLNQDKAADIGCVLLPSGEWVIMRNPGGIPVRGS